MGEIYVISGAPGTGKTSVLRELQLTGHEVIEEAARKIKQQSQNIGEIQNSIFEIQKQQLMNSKGTVFSDRGLGDTIAYSKFYETKIPLEITEFAKQFRYKKIFLMDFLKEYRIDMLRKETPEQQKQIQELIIKAYEELGYGLIKVPLMSVEERVEFIKKKVLESKRDGNKISLL